MKFQEDKTYITVEQKMLKKLRIFFFGLLPCAIILIMALNSYFLTRGYKKAFENAFAIYTARQDKDAVETARATAAQGYVDDYKAKIERAKQLNPNFKEPNFDEEKFKASIIKKIKDVDTLPQGTFNIDKLQHPHNKGLLEIYSHINTFAIITGSINLPHKITEPNGKVVTVTYNKFVSDYARDSYGRRLAKFKLVKSKVDGLNDKVYLKDKKGQLMYTVVNPVDGKLFNTFLMFCIEIAAAYYIGYAWATKRPPFYTYHGTAKFAESFDLIFTHDTKKIYEIDLVNVDDGVILGRFDAPFKEYRYFEHKNTLKGILKSMQNQKDPDKKKKAMENIEKMKFDVDFHKLIPLIPDTSSGQKVVKNHYERIWKPEQIILKDDSKTHVIVAAPTRTGKGVSIITPSLLEWTQSVFVLDIKGENYQNTAYCRKNRWNNIIIRYAPKSDNSSSYNPLGEIRMMTNKEAEDIMNIANIVTTKEKPDPFWDTSAASLLRADITRIIYEVFLNEPEFEDANGNIVDRALINDETLCTKYFPVVKGNLGQVFDYLVSSQFTLPRIAILKMQSTVEDFFSYCKDEELVRMIQNKLCQIYPNFRELIAGGKPLTYEEAMAQSGIDTLPGMGGKEIKLPTVNNYTKMDYTHINPDGSFNSTNVAHEIKWHTGRKHPEVVSGFTDSSQASENTTSTIIKVTTTCISLFGLPTVRKNTSVSDFRIRDLMFYKKPMSLYLVVLPADILDVAPLVRIMIVQLVNGLTPEQDYRNEVKPPHKLLMLLDEFPAIGKIEVLETAAGFVAGYGMKLMLINQSLDQLFQIYGEKNKFMGNCQLQIFYTANDNGTGEYVSKAVGNETIRMVTNKSNMTLFNGNKANPSENFTGRPLISPDQLRRLPLNKILIILGGKTPIMTDKIRYFTDPQFMYWSKNIPLIGSESCYNLDKQYFYNDPAKTYADIEFLLGDNRTKYVPYREQLDDEWKYASTDSEINRMNLFERIWLINANRQNPDKYEKGWQSKGLKEGQLGLKLGEIEPDLEVNAAKFENARAMLLKAGIIDSKGNILTEKIKPYKYEKVADPLQEHRSLTTFIRVNDVDFFKKGASKLTLAGHNEEHISTDKILAICLKYYKKHKSNKSVIENARNAKKTDKAILNKKKKEAEENKKVLERQKNATLVTDADTDMTANASFKVMDNIKNGNTVIKEAQTKSDIAEMVQSQADDKGLSAETVANATNDITKQRDEDFKAKYGENYEENMLYLKEIQHMNENEIISKMQQIMGDRYNRNVELEINSMFPHNKI